MYFAYLLKSMQKDILASHNEKDNTISSLVSLCILPPIYTSFIPMFEAKIMKRVETGS